jgi:hypothetical protein
MMPQNIAAGNEKLPLNVGNQPSASGLFILPLTACCGTIFA